MARKNNKKSYTHRFLDLEASTDESEEGSDDLSGYYFVNYLPVQTHGVESVNNAEDEDDAHENQTPHTAIMPISLSETSRFDFLRDLEERVIAQLPSPSENDCDETRAVEPTSSNCELSRFGMEDYPTFSVRCSLGKEAQIVINLTSSLRLRGIQGVRSIFCSPKAPGRFYVEAGSWEVIIQVTSLLSLSEMRSGSGPQIFVVPTDELTNLMSFDVATSQLSPNSWVKVKRGIYRNDIGRATHCDNDVIIIQLVPRVDIVSTLNKGKRKRGEKSKTRPEAALLPKQLLENRGLQVQASGDDEFIFQNLRFTSSGLHVLSLPRRDAESVFPHISDIHLLLTATMSSVSEDHEKYFNSGLKLGLPRFHHQFLRLGDAIRIVGGCLSGCSGTLIENPVGHKVFVDLDEEREWPGSVQIRNVEVELEFLERTFRRGDRVAVRVGVHAGKKGLALVADENFVLLKEDQCKEEIVLPIAFVETAPEENLVESDEVRPESPSVGDTVVFRYGSEPLKRGRVLKCDQGFFVVEEEGSHMKASNSPNANVTFNMNEDGTEAGLPFSYFGQPVLYAKDEFAKKVVGQQVYILQGQKKGWIGRVKALGANTAQVDIGAAIQGQSTIEVTRAHLLRCPPACSHS
ncbi:hypothetical protein SCHPADRAFT_947037 [Schizopora paradoxa]|uniref:NGN domain-containing protein n=1 Tax=Schizopora paradoxa TaxID=27342 RepID=A0A0H2R1U1_9AGAM|nr:hypothetical protein SCHPADRAFT_947037 [Schizopora paradoxa]